VAASELRKMNVGSFSSTKSKRQKSALRSSELANEPKVCFKPIVAIIFSTLSGKRSVG